MGRNRSDYYKEILYVEAQRDEGVLRMGLGLGLGLGLRFEVGFLRVKVVR